MFVSLVRDKHGLVFLCICNFLNSVTILFFFFLNHLPKLGTRVHLIRVYEAFKETNFAHVFLFIIYDVYIATVSTLIK
jgi:hypothetical protein